jgi:hypothetical protein
MAIVVLHDFPGGTQEQYDQVIAQLNLGGYSPQGNLFHVVGMVEGVMRVVDVWESESAFNAFMSVLRPLMQSAGMAAPQVTTWLSHNMLTPRGYGIGNYERDLSATPAPVTDDLTFEIEPPQEA